MAEHNMSQNESDTKSNMDPPSRPHKRTRSAASASTPLSTVAVDSVAEASESREYKVIEAEPKLEPTKEELYEQAKARKIAAISARNTHLEAEIARVTAEIEAERALLQNKDAAGTVKTHIKLLHEYNEIRDVGQGMMGMIADNRGVRIAELYESGEFGVGVKD